MKKQDTLIKSDAKQFASLLNDLMLDICRVLSKFEAKNREQRIRFGSKYEITSMQTHLLKCIALDAPLRVADLAQVTNRTSSALIPHLNALEDKELIKRYRPRDNRRIVLLELTPKGKQVLQEYEEQEYRPPYFEKIQHLPSAKQKELVKTLKFLHSLLVTEEEE